MFVEVTSFIVCILLYYIILLLLVQDELHHCQVHCHFVEVLWGDGGHIATIVPEGQGRGALCSVF